MLGVAQLVRMQAGLADRLPGGVEVAASEVRRPHRPAAADGGEDQVVRCLALDLLGEEVRDRDLTALVRLRRRPDEPLALHDSDGLGDHGAALGQVEPTDLERGHLPEPDAGVNQEEYDQAVGLAVTLGIGAMLGVAVG